MTNMTLKVYFLLEDGGHVLISCSDFIINRPVTHLNAFNPLPGFIQISSSVL